MRTILRFRLRTLLIFMVLLSGFLACFMHAYQAGDAQLAAVHRLEELGMTVLRDDELLGVRNFDYQENELFGLDIDQPHIEVPLCDPRVGPRAPIIRDHLQRRLFDKYTTVMILHHDEFHIPAKRIASMLGELPHLKSVYINPRSCSTKLSPFIQKALPAVNVQFNDVPRDKPPFHLDGSE